MKRIILLLMAIALIGCSNEKVETKNESPVDTNQPSIEEEKEDDSGSTSQLQTLENVTTAVSLETLKQLPSGILTENIPHEQETERVLWGYGELDGELQTNMEEALLEIAKETTDPKQLAKSFIYLLGSPSYKQIVEELENFTPGFNEPLLPRPEKVRGEEVVEGESYSYILLDASSSMLLDSQGRQRMDIAKDAVERFAKTIGETSQVSLIAFGHKGDQSNSGKALSCSEIEEVYPLGKYDGEGFQTAVSTVEAKGWTPLAAAIDKANELSKSLQGNITLYIVSDGIETCDGDPIKAAERFVESNKDTNKTVNIIGFQVDQDAEKQLAQVADAGNGEYYSANNGDELISTIEYEWLPSLLELIWAPVNLAPDGWEIFRESEKVSNLSSQWTAAIMRENHRFRIGMKVLEEEGNIPNEVISEVKEILDTREGELNKLNEELRDLKRALVDEKAAEIRERVEEWVEEMKEIKKTAQ